MVDSVSKPDNETRSRWSRKLVPSKNIFSCPDTTPSLLIKELSIWLNGTVTGDSCFSSRWTTAYCTLRQASPALHPKIYSLLLRIVVLKMVPFNYHISWSWIMSLLPWHTQTQTWTHTPLLFCTNGHSKSQTRNYKVPHCPPYMPKFSPWR